MIARRIAVQQPAAVDVEDVTRDVRRLVRRQEHSCVADVARYPEAPEDRGVAH